MKSVGVWSSALLVTLLTSVFAYPCHSRFMNEPDLVCRTADVIVTAVAVNYIDPLANGAESGEIAFEIKEILKGHPLKHFLYLQGTLTDTDDFNTSPVPYDVVRSSGLRGSCFATDYRKGGLFLLCMIYDRYGGLTPYWGSMSPTSEQIKAVSDPWLAWVKTYLAKNECARRWGMNVEFYLLLGSTMEQVTYHLGNECKKCANPKEKLLNDVFSNPASCKQKDSIYFPTMSKATDSYFIYRKTDYRAGSCKPEPGDTIVGFREGSVLWWVPCYGTTSIQFNTRVAEELSPKQESKTAP